MDFEILYVFGVLIAAIALFISDKVRLDLVAVLVIIALILGGILTPAEGFSGFGATVVILIGGLFVVGEGLAQTGVSYGIGDKIVQYAGKGEMRLIALLMIAVAFLSAFMSSTGAVAIFVPVAMRLASRANVHPSKLLMPLAFGALIGGMLTLIGTPPNIVMSAQLEQAGLAPFNFFDFTPLGLVFLAVAITYFGIYGSKVLGRRHTNPATSEGRRSVATMLKTYKVAEHIVQLRIEEGSELIGKNVVEAHLRTLIGFTVFGVSLASDKKNKVVAAHTDIKFEAGDILHGVLAENCQNDDVSALFLTRIETDTQNYHMSARELGLADIIITQNSRMVGQTLVESNFRKLYDLGVIAIMRRGKPVEGNLSEAVLEFGDQLLVAGDWNDIRKMRQERNHFLVVSFPEEFDDLVPHPQRAWVATGIVAFMLLLIITKFVPTVVAIIAAALLMAVTGCVNSKTLYKRIDWPSLVLIAGMLPMATALEKSGGLQMIVDSLLEMSGDSHPVIMLISLFVMTSLFSQVISNTATSVLVAPVALGAAQLMSINPEPLLLAVAVAASTSFATPVASPVNMLVLGPGGYRFRDFVIVGLPLQILALILSALLIPVLFPFT